MFSNQVVFCTFRMNPTCRSLVVSRLVASLFSSQVIFLMGVRFGLLAHKIWWEMMQGSIPGLSSGPSKGVMVLSRQSVITIFVFLDSVRFVLSCVFFPSSHIWHGIVSSPGSILSSILIWGLRLVVATWFTSAWWCYGVGVVGRTSLKLVT